MWALETFLELRKQDSFLSNECDFFVVVSVEKISVNVRPLDLGVFTVIWTHGWWHGQP